MLANFAAVRLENGHLQVGPPQAYIKAALIPLSLALMLYTHWLQVSLSARQLGSHIIILLLEENSSTNHH